MRAPPPFLGLSGLAASSPSQSIAACTPPLPCGMPSACSVTSVLASTPRIIGALIWPIWAMRSALPVSSPMPTPSTTPQCRSQYCRMRLRVEAFLQQDRGDGVGALGRLDDIEFHRAALGPHRDRAAHRLGQQGVPPEDVLQPLFEQHVDRLAQAEQQVLRRRPAVFLVVLVAVALGPVPVARAQAPPSCAPPPRAVPRRRSPARRRHQALLRAGDRDVDAPAVHVEGHGAERGDGVDHQQRAVAGVGHGLADGRDVVDHARRGVDLDHQHGLDRARLVLAQPRLERRRIDRAAPGAGQGLDGRRPSSRRSRPSRPRSGRSPGRGSVSPRDSTLLTAASQAPWPLAA